MSFCAIAIVAAMMAVSAPTIAITIIMVGAFNTIGESRASRYNPLVTMVAAWMSAETGVGPAIASGNQVNNGICALLPVAAKKSRSTDQFSVDCGSPS